MSEPLVVLFDRLLDDAALRADWLPPAAAVAQHLRCRDGAYAALLGPLLVPDTQLAAVSRSLPPGARLEVSVVASGGAGGLVALGERRLPGIEVVAVETAVRDLADAAANAARIVSAIDALGLGVPVFVELPLAPRWVWAVEVIEAAGLQGGLRLAAALPPEAARQQLAEQMSVLVEADLPFKVVGAESRDATTPLTPLGLLRAVDALVDEASPAEAAAILAAPELPATSGGAPQLAAALASWTDGDQQRVRHRLRSLDCPDTDRAARELTGGVSGPGDGDDDAL